MDSKRPKTNIQIPLPPNAGFVSEVTHQEHDDWLASLDQPTRPAPPASKVGDRVIKCLGMADLTYRERLVLAVIAYHDGEGGAYPSQARIAEMVGIPRPTVSEVVQCLNRKGRLNWRRGHGYMRRANFYVISYGEPYHCQGNPDNGRNEPMSGKSGFQCQGNPDTNRNEPEGASRGREREDLCEGNPCRHAVFVESGESCRRCGWRRVAVA